MALLYLLDANVLIHANKDYYPLDRMKGFWIGSKAKHLTG